MVVQTRRGLVLKDRRQGLTGGSAASRSDQIEIDVLVEQAADARIALTMARDSGRIGELLALVYRCEDRIKAITRGSQHRQSTRIRSRL